MKTSKEYVIENIKDWLITIWTLLQNILGFIVALVTDAKREERNVNNTNYIIYISRRFNKSWSGVSLGDYVIFASSRCANITAIKHEYGHQKQSLYLGPLYLFVIGIPSVLGNLWDRVAHRNWLEFERIKWYYSQPHEHWADVLGQVDRGF